MRILFVMTPAFNPNAGGVQRTTFKLGKYFTEQGLEVAYFSTAHQRHVEVSYGRLFHGSAAGGVNNATNIDVLRDVLHDWRPDWVINQMPYEQALRDVLEENKNVVGYRLLGCLRNSLFNFKSNIPDRMREMLPGPLFRLLNNPLGVALVGAWHRSKHRRDLKAIIDQHDLFILLAPPNRQELAYFVGDYKAEKVISIPNSIPEVSSGPLDKEKIILHVGRLNVRQKRSDLLLDFWQHAHAQLPDWTFVIVGDGEYGPTLKKDLQKRNLPRIEWVGRQRSEPYYQRASIFMMPSAFEGFPNTILEAQSYGCASLAFDSYAALEWIVNDGEDAILVPPYDTKQMAERAVALALDPEQLEQMSLAARENARQFTIDKVGEQWLELFNRNAVLA